MVIPFILAAVKHDARKGGKTEGIVGLFSICGEVVGKPLGQAAARIVVAARHNDGDPAARQLAEKAASVEIVPLILHLAKVTADDQEVKRLPEIGGRLHDLRIVIVQVGHEVEVDLPLAPYGGEGKGRALLLFKEGEVGAAKGGLAVENGIFAGCIQCRLGHADPQKGALGGQNAGAFLIIEFPPYAEREEPGGEGVEKDLIAKDELTEELFRINIEIANKNKSHRVALAQALEKFKSMKYPKELAQARLTDEIYEIETLEEKKMYLYNKLQNVRQELNILSVLLKNEQELLK